MHLILFSPLTPLEHTARHVLNWLHGSIRLPWLVDRRVDGDGADAARAADREADPLDAEPAALRAADKEIQKKYKADKKRQNEELMKFYRENNVNPAASCLPMLAQFPVFIALYYSLKTFAHEPPSQHPGSLSFLHFIPSIADHTTSHWGGFVLLVVYVASQMASTLYMSATADKTQRMIFMFMPVVFVFVIAHFPAGLVLYWVTTNLWTVGQGLVRGG